MSMFRIFDIAGSGLSAQTLRLNTVASNLANAESVAPSEDAAYRARNPVFAAVFNQFATPAEAATAQVAVKGVVESQAPITRRYEPGNPLADENGFVYQSNVNIAEEMANMISASRSYQTNVQVMNTTRQLIQATLRLGQ
ncbi:MAG: flagellar basal body rod protein FlgC [Gammaproteobacteria bacterium]|nr:MAG: flagellar basal body rod protein FlgC [Gammaproteobacteria bacterium]